MLNSSQLIVILNPLIKENVNFMNQRNNLSDSTLVFILPY